MRGICSVVFVLILWTGVAVGSTNDSKTVLFLSTPTVDITMANKTFKFMDMNTRGDMRSDHTLLKVKGFSPEEQLKIFSSMRADSDALVVVMVDQEISQCPVVIYSEKLGAAVVNISSFMNDEGFNDEVKLALINRASMYALGRLAGVKACLNPYCALSEYKVFKKDQIPGRNFCPNCIDLVANQLKSNGVSEKPEKINR